MLSTIDIGGNLELVLIIAIVIICSVYKGNSERRYK